MFAVNIILVVYFITVVIGKRNEIGYVPIKGNLWRAKHISEIYSNVSREFEDFTRHCKTTISENTGIVYHYSPNGTVYSLAYVDQTMCVYTLDRSLLSNVANISNLTFYFACDDTCCAMECCQRDLQMTIIGIALIVISICIFVFYVSIYFGGLFCAWKNGALGRRHTVSARSPLHHKESIILKNGTFDS
ncbi:hypothetical protein KIN20_003162 [Parelaphostrongylus tenuis]|uniref:CX domain-containing protein n=1 Tax=Parelaphostrongylus tenuis TaxID=148309 RepID=A0AAD5QE27_PARTN|nr:hypothetical protein KIN20_003162 [Parelaphostrongylus tenuis]